MTTTKFEIRLHEKKGKAKSNQLFTSCIFHGLGLADERLTQCGSAWPTWVQPLINFSSHRAYECRARKIHQLKLLISVAFPRLTIDKRRRGFGLISRSDVEILISLRLTNVKGEINFLSSARPFFACLSCRLFIHESCSTLKSINVKPHSNLTAAVRSSETKRCK